VLRANEMVPAGGCARDSVDSGKARSGVSCGAGRDAGKVFGFYSVATAMPRLTVERYRALPRGTEV
jgi:hypothetical protein